METKLIDIILTDSQNDKLVDVLDSLEKGRKRIVLKGSAGVGKTTLVNFLLRNCSVGGGLMYISAPTHKALSVLKSKIDLDEDEDPVVFCTIHKGLKLKMVINGKNGSKSFQQKFPKNDPPFPQCGLLIIDEASMLNQKMIDLLGQYDFPIIFIGDEKQINPVKEVDSPVFKQNWYEVELTEIIRQGEGNPIIELSRNLPQISMRIEYTNINEGEKSGFLYSNERNKVIYKLAQVNGTDELKYLAWTNAEVDAINFSVRATIYGDNPALIEEGETLVLNAQYAISEEDVLHNNYELKVKTLAVIDRVFFCEKERFEYKVYQINGNVFAVHEEFLGIHAANIRRLKSLAINKVISWRQWYAFAEKFLDFKYNHAITVHKSQGSTYKDAIINIGDISKNRLKEERQRLLYTAITRASNLIILYNV